MKGHLDVRENTLAGITTTIIWIAGTSDITVRDIGVGGFIRGDIRTPALLALENCKSIIGIAGGRAKPV